MTLPPLRLLLDTNIFIIGFLDPNSPEGDLLTLLETIPQPTLIFSNDLEQQIRRVGRRLQIPLFERKAFLEKYAPG